MLLIVLLLRNEHVFDHALVDPMIVSQMLPQSQLSFVKLLTDVALVRSFFKVNQSEVTLGAAEESEGSSADQALAATVLIQFGHAVPRH